MLYTASVAKFLHAFLLSIKTVSSTNTCIKISFLFWRITQLNFIGFGQVMETTGTRNHQNIASDEFKRLIIYIFYIYGIVLCMHTCAYNMLCFRFFFGN